MYQRKTKENLECGIFLAAKVFGGKWKPCIIDAIHKGYHRPSELHRLISGATPRVIDLQLSELAAHNVVYKTTAEGFPLRSTYYLTPLGESIVPIIQAMDEWGKVYRQPVLS